MGIIISAAITRTGGVSSVGQAAEAARAALDAAGCPHEQVDALINVGVYRDANLVEPAVAALIQQVWASSTGPAMCRACRSTS
jgi:3-oxoacyl-[acyl-carrier-protein] synthase-3